MRPAPGSFRTGAAEPIDGPVHAPLREVRVSDRPVALGDEELVRADDEGHVLHCEARGGFLAGTAKVTIQVEGPSDLPSSTVHVRSETEGGLLARDKAIVASFVRPFHRRVC